LPSQQQAPFSLTQLERTHRVPVESDRPVLEDAMAVATGARVPVREKAVAVDRGHRLGLWVWPVKRPQHDERHRREGQHHQGKRQVSLPIAGLVQTHVSAP
jgi:hypothetical protein